MRMVGRGKVRSIVQRKTINKSVVEEYQCQKQ